MTLTIATHQVAPTKTIYELESGCPHPLGATPKTDGVNFSIFAEHAQSVELLLFEYDNDPWPTQVIRLNPRTNKTFHYWHVFVRGLKPGAYYAYRVDGPRDLHGSGHRFNKNKVLIDPYAKGNTNTLWQRIDALGSKDNVATSMRSVVIDISDYDWEGDRPINRPMSETIIYEVHVGGFTRSLSSGSKNPGTFSAIIEKIPYLQDLGITAVELLPIFDFDEKNVVREVNGSQLRDYWGYNPHSYFAPEGSYCVFPDAGNQIREFRDMVKALHKAGIEVILDVVFNHTDEGNHEGPIINFKGLMNSIFYHLVPFDKQYYMDYSGCGNTVNCNHPMVEKLILDCLEFWVKEMHVDGFRFDEGSILSRGQDGVPMAHPPVVWHIETSETLADTKIIAEAWDAAGLYQIGYFPGYRWAEWNGRFRDDIRRFVKGDPGMVGAVAWRMSGSADLYEARGHLPINSINFITCHDGFTLNDLVSYNHKHNEANGEDNRDGINDNLSWNCGVEGETDNPEIDAFRKQQIKNFTAILLLSQGVPMFVAGDEVRRTQKGNNNAYCQDNEISWFDWNLLEKNSEIFRFFKLMINFRKCYCHSTLHRRDFFTGEVNERGLADISWHGCRLFSSGWHDPHARVIAFTLGGFEGAADIHIMLNMYWESLEFEIPPIEGRRWYTAIDTAQPSPMDIVEKGQETLVPGNVYLVKDRSVVVLISK
ncbi:glycogen debranching protein GlgX [Aetokthonos hydrillicola Thurmond2011]|jgi:glycogen operon protein|uniref:Glycogen debranching protein GlgX n=1 Tax=Aetokthonos hydrillicola Thurmond2011 TaxID=2712845 RepID=A0AAP5M5W3_9CYAN|nr:glycogen debranching protein GlgX [Aetokthonos hydrillicola]MBO3459384.1 glycogen debranching protein GlgX [Aetokthonos hydrillicola CCALA 1050]MBW4586530.1 glycogen debranching protein GlgX [Aetokthonos hydrillicola CCALA 1050]MDR9893525.1 glycogen debranching protein GlgX [Aetokthonos hydrillicola Thurmond2011]